MEAFDLQNDLIMIHLIMIQGIYLYRITVN